MKAQTKRPEKQTSPTFVPVTVFNSASSRIDADCPGATLRHRLWAKHLSRESEHAGRYNLGLGLAHCYAALPMPEILSGLVERVTYDNPENGFAVLKVKVKGRQDLVTVVGSTTSDLGDGLVSVGAAQGVSGMEWAI